MTDTDKLKRLAEALLDDDDCPMLVPPRTILALIAENERLSGALKTANDGFEKHERLWYLAKDERNEAVALLRSMDKVRMYDGQWAPVSAFLARIDGGV